MIALQGAEHPGHASVEAVSLLETYDRVIQLTVARERRAACYGVRTVLSSAFMDAVAAKHTNATGARAVLFVGDAGMG